MDIHLKYEYDISNRLVKILDTSNALIASYTYDAAGRQTTKTLGNGMCTTYTYDNLNRLTKLSNLDLNGKIQSQSDYAYNSAGLFASVKTLDGRTIYTYDDANQLTNIKYPNSEVKFNFDAVGNRLNVETNLAITPYLTNKLNQYTEVGKTHFEYDLNGNLETQTLNGNKISYEWNENNQLKRVIGNGVQTSYDYDYGGRLVSKVANGIERHYVWDRENLVAEMDSSGNLLTRYVYGSNTNDVVKISSGGNNAWPQLDELGSTIGYTKDDGTLVEKLSYDVYGNIQSGNINEFQQGFAGMWWDSDSNLYYSRSGWYDASNGRFVNENFPPTPRNTYSENSLTSRLGFQTRALEGESLFLAPNGAPTGIVFRIYRLIMSELTKTSLKNLKWQAICMEDIGQPTRALSAKISHYSFYRLAFKYLAKTWCGF